MQSQSESKREQPNNADYDVPTETSSNVDKRLRQAKHELLRTLDRWGKQLPTRLLSSILEYSASKEIARSQAVCQTWCLPANLSDRLWRTRYDAAWEVET